jgi:hypothetical protein
VKVSFYLAGAALEGFGIILLGLPDIIPYRERLSVWLTGRYRRGMNRLRLLIRRPRTQVVVPLGIPSEESVALGASVVKRVGAGMSLEEQVALLREHDQETQEGLNDLRGRLDALTSGTLKRFEETRAEMEDHVSVALASAFARYRPIRVVGAVLLLVGLGLSTAGNLVS